MPSPLENNLLLQMISGVGAELAAPDPVIARLDKMTQQNIAAQSQDKTNKSYIQLLKQILEKGGKINMDKENLSIKAPSNIFSGDGGSALAGDNMKMPFDASADHKAMMMGGAVPSQYVEPGLQPLDEVRNLNPSPSPLGVNAADLAGLTPENVSQALSGALGVVDLERRSIRDVADTVYQNAIARKLRAETAAITPSIEIAPGVKLTGKEFVDVWKAASKDERTGAIKNYEYARDNGYEGSFESWMKELAEAQGKNLSEILAEFAAKGQLKEELEIKGIDYFTKIRQRLDKDPEWTYSPPNWKEIRDKHGLTDTQAKEKAKDNDTLKAAEDELRGKYPNLERRVDGWYSNGKLVRKNPYYGKQY